MSDIETQRDQEEPVEPTAESDASVDEVSTTKPRRRWRITRRGFLIAAGVGAGALALGYAFGKPALHLQMANSMDGATRAGSFTEDPFVWFEVLPDSTIRLYLGKVEMGQGVHTSLAQVAAEELGITLAELEVAQATTAVGPADVGTTGSSSVSTVYTPLRTMAATFQQMLRSEASMRLGVAESDLLIEGKSFVSKGDASKSISFGDIVAGKQGEWEVPDVEIPLTREWRLIGTATPRIDIPDKITGRTRYGFDMRVPGMKYGAVLRPPTIEGKLKSADTVAAAAMPGVVKVVQEGDFVGVVADTRAQAYAAVAAVEALWDEGKLWTQEEIDAMLVPEGNDGIVIQKEGDAEAQLKQETTLRSEYLSPFAIQTPLEAQAALAEVVDGKAKVWVSTQMQSAVLPVVAEATGLDEENIEVIPTYLGGGFGRKSGFESAGEAARLAKASGVPVHVGWNRTEELRYGYFRPPTHSILSGRLDDNGKMVALEHSQASGDVAADFVPSFLTAMMGADFGAVRGARIHYDAVPNIKTLAYRRPLPVRTGWWRGLGLLANNYAIESFVDEMAIAAGKDPVQFRIDHLGESTDQQRLRRVIEKVAEMADWGSPAPEGRGRGIACIADVGTMVAEIAEVSVDATSGVIRVHNFWAAMDCGLTVNPDGARAQVEGNVMWGVGSSLLEEMRVENGRIPVGNFDTYPLLTMKQAPHVEVELLEAGDGIPRGVGEPPIAPVAAAVANAFFALTGKRLRQIPFTPERVMAALTA